MDLKQDFPTLLCALAASSVKPKVDIDQVLRLNILWM